MCHVYTRTITVREPSDRGVSFDTLTGPSTAKHEHAHLLPSALPDLTLRVRDRCLSQTKSPGGRAKCRQQAYIDQPFVRGVEEGLDVRAHGW